MRRPDVPWRARGDEETEKPERALVATTARAGSKKTPGAIHGGNLGKKGAQSPAERSD